LAAFRRLATPLVAAEVPDSVGKILSSGSGEAVGFSPVFGGSGPISANQRDMRVVSQPK